MQSDLSLLHRQTEVLDPARASALLTTLGMSSDMDVGQALPPFFHQLYFWDVHQPDDLGPDGHPALGGFIPDMGLPRRMWAGGNLSFHQPLLAGVQAEKCSRVLDVTQKEGRSGSLAFVRLAHELWQNETLCVSEQQDLVYRNAFDPRDPKATPAKADRTAKEVQPIAFNSTVLFRYSALTMNGHRIHYDLDYAREQEGYDGLVVHGPLLAQLLMLWAQEHGPMKEFHFRATAPLMHFETGRLCRDGDAYWVEGPDRRLCMTATVKRQSPT